METWNLAARERSLAITMLMSGSHSVSASWMNLKNNTRDIRSLFSPLLFFPFNAIYFLHLCRNNVDKRASSSYFGLARRDSNFRTSLSNLRNALEKLDN